MSATRDRSIFYLAAVSDYLRFLRGLTMIHESAEVFAVEAARRALVPEMPKRLALALERGEPTWTTEELRKEFEVIAFAAPLVVARRHADGAMGSLSFTHEPRVYFDWQSYED